MKMLKFGYLVETYGLRLNAEQLAQVLGITVVALHTQRSKGTLGVRTYTDGGRIWADVTDVVDYFERMREVAA